MSAYTHNDFDLVLPSPATRKTLNEWAREVRADYSPLMGWLVKAEDNTLYNIFEPEGATIYTGNNTVLAITGGFYKAHGDGAEHDENGNKYRTNKAYFIDLMGFANYSRIFNKG